MNLFSWFSADNWRKLTIPGWIVSVVTHGLTILVLCLWALPTETEEEQVDLESFLERIEEAKLDELETEPLPLEPPENLEPEIPVEEEPVMSTLSPLAELEEPATVSPIDMPNLDNVATMLEGPNFSGSAALGQGSTFDSRGDGVRKAMVGSQGGTKQTEQAVNAGLGWLIRHQFPDGHWSLHQLPCRRGNCSGESQLQADMAATAFGLLPFLAAGHTHLKGPYKSVVGRALNWMISHQDRTTGDLSKGIGSNAPMYAHGLAAIALAEAFALTKDKTVGQAAQLAIQYIEYAQHPENGGWRYRPQAADGDTSVVGWQIMALKSAQMGGLRVQPKTFELARSFLDFVAGGESGGLFGYTDNKSISPTRTSIGLLCIQYLGAGRKDAAVQEGMEYLKRHPPTLKQRNSYYWYYATQVMHNIQGSDWDAWNRQMRRIWIDTQERKERSCQHGSWDPEQPVPDQGSHGRGGRLMTTAVGLLTLEVYYRYLPLYKVMHGQDELAATE